MKIAIFTDSFLPKIDGIVTATINLSKGLADRRHQVYIIAPKYKNIKEFKYKNIKVIRIKSIPAFFYEDFRFTSFFSLKLLSYLRKEKIEIIHFQTPLTIGMQAILISKSLKIPLVGTFHTFFADPQYLKHVKLNFNYVGKISWKYAKLYYNKCDLISCPSETTKNELIEKGFKEPIIVISNGIDKNIFNNSKWKKVRAEYNKDGDLLLFIGRIAHEKNIFYLLECFSLVIKKLPKTKLLLIGSGPQLDEVKKKIKSLNLNNNIILTGRIEHNLLIKSSIFKACDLFVTASTTENQPMTILEAQINKLVCIGINEKGMINLVKTGYNGILVKNNDKEAFAEAVINILSNKNLLKKMQANTLKEIKKHELNNVIDLWEQNYKRILSKKFINNHVLLNK